ncbi:hypothetical protein WJX81_000228 [Elliptochloris bilobata]|uniref:ABC transporter domain-containing protein n=1 Tax=Elliptochloris bilobata TaxID=381761 RepID=A0AAW1QPJ9_9CHLO
MVTFQDLEYRVANNAKWRETVTLLTGVSGSLHPRQMLALLGPSGSGKTTLLDLLAGRKTTGALSGRILYSGHAPSKPFPRRHTGYVEQCDTLLGNLTVQEMLAYTAELKGPAAEPLAAKLARVDAAVATLGLASCRPVVATVAALAAGGITVCATIHSPSAAVFRQFDRLMLLLGGRLALAAAYQGSALRAANDERLKRDADAAADLPPAMLAEMAARCSSSTSTPAAHGLHVILLPASQAEVAYRGRRDLADFPGYLAPRVLDKLAVALLIMTLYWGVGRPAEGAAAIARAINLSAALFMWTVLPGFAAAAYCPTLVEERLLFNRELSDGLYQPITYLAAKLLSEGAVALVQSLALCALTYFPLHLGGQWVLYWFVYFLTTCIGVVLAYAIAALSPNIYVANAALPAYVITPLFFVGQLMRPSDQPAHWKWYGYLDFLRYGWIAQMVNQFEHSHVFLAFNVERSEMRRPAD